MFGIDDALLGLAAQYLIPLAGDAVASLFGDSDKPAAKAVTTTVASAALQIAGQLTGQPVRDADGAQAAAAAIQADPAKLADYQRQLAEQAAQAFRDETDRLRVVNETMRAEATSADPYVRRMRPTFGYVMAATWGAQMLAASYVVAFRPAEASGVLNGIASTTTLWGIGLAVLGVYVYKRSAEKGAESGIIGPAQKAIKAR